MNEKYLKFLLVIPFGIAAIGLIGFTDEESSRKALVAEGFKEIKFTGNKPMVCGPDIYRTEFKAKNATGLSVTGTVCCGIMKGCTIKW